jgi:uncharacterized protein (DUF2147 family)
MLRSLSVFTLLGFGLAFSAAQAAEPTGVWSTPEGKSRVQISACGDALCGRILSLKEPNGPDGKPKLDSKNQNAGQRGRPLVGLSLLSGMKPNGDQWQGSIYNPEDGKTYKAKMALDGDNRLNVSGCVAAILCKTQNWTRVK